VRGVGWRGTKGSGRLFGRMGGLLARSWGEGEYLGEVRGRREPGSVVKVRWDGNKLPTILHVSFVEMIEAPDDEQSTAV